MPTLPLGRFRMLDLSRQLPGPFCSTLLADLGMDVLVVAAPRDPFGIGIPFLARNKRSMTLNLKTRRRARDPPPPRRRRRRRCSRASAPASCSGSGSTTRRCARATRASSTAPSPATARTARTATASATTSTTSATPACSSTAAPPDGPPMIPGVQIADIGGGSLMAAVGILAALMAREQTGRGQFVDIAMLDGAAAWNVYHQALHWYSGQLPAARPRAAHRPLAVLRRLRDARRPLRHRRRLRAALLGHALPPLRARGLRRRPVGGGATRRDVRASSAPRSARRRWPSGWPSWAGKDICFGPVLNLDEAYDDPQLRHRGMVVEMDTAAGPRRYIGSPDQALRRRPPSSRTPPAHVRPAHRRGAARARLRAERHRRAARAGRRSPDRSDGRSPSMARVIDSDAHVVEGREFMAEMLERFPDKIRFAEPGRGHGALHRGPRLPAVERTRRRLPRRGGHVPRPRRQPVDAGGRARRRRPRGHRRHGVLPERGARAARATRTSASPPRWRAPTTPGWPAGAGAATAASTASALVPIEDVPTSITIMREAKTLGPEGHHGPGGAEDAEPRPSRPRAVLRRGGRPRHAARHPRRARHPPAQPGLAPLRQLPPGALRELPVRHDGGVDGARPGRRLRAPSEAARRAARVRRRLGAVLHGAHGGAPREARPADARVQARAARSTSRAASSTSAASPRRSRCRSRSRRSATTSSCTPATTRTGTRTSRTRPSRCASGATSPTRCARRSWAATPSGSTPWRRRAQDPNQPVCPLKLLGAQGAHVAAFGDGRADRYSPARVARGLEGAIDHAPVWIALADR